MNRAARISSVAKSGQVGAPHSFGSCSHLHQQHAAHSLQAVHALCVFHACGQSAMSISSACLPLAEFMQGKIACE
jgi:hypothetical protein